MKYRSEMTDGGVKAANRKLAFFNILIIAVSAACIFSLAFTNFWSFKMTIKPTKEIITGLVPEQAAEGEESNLNFDELLDGINFEFQIKVSPKGFLDGVKAKSREARIEAVFTPAFNELSKQVKGVFSQAMVFAVRMARSMVANEVKETVSSASEAAVEDMPVDLKDLLDGLDGVIGDILSAEGMKAGDAEGEIVAYLLGKLDMPVDETPGSDYMKIKEEMVSQVDSILGGMLDPITDSEGYIKPETFIYNALGKILYKDGGEFDPDNFIKEMSAKLAESNAVNVLVWGLIAFWGIPIIAWALLAVFAILRLFLRKKGVSMTLARALCWIPCALIWLLPTLLFLILPKVAGTLLPKIMPALAEGAGAGVANLKDMFSIKFGATGPIISACGTLALMLFNLFGYKRAKRKVKRNA